MISQQTSDYEAELLIKRKKQTETEAEPTCAGDDDVYLSDDFVQLHQTEAIHAAVGETGNEDIRFMLCGR